MKVFLKSLKLACLDCHNYLNTLKFRLWLPFFLSSIFLGWNGLQILFSLNLIISFVNTGSITRLVYTTMEYNLRSIPIYLFVVITFFIIHWIIHSLLETGFSYIIRKQKRGMSRVLAVGFNFFVPNLLVVVSIFFIIIALFMLSMFLNIIFSGYSFTDFSNLETNIYRVLGLSLFLSIIATMWLTDYVLPRMTEGDTFKHAFLRAALKLNTKPFTIICFYLIKLILIILSIYLFRIVLRHALLPFFIMLEKEHSIGFFLLSGRNLLIGNVFSNLRTIFVVLFASLFVFTPILAPLYLFQRFLLFRLNKV